MTNEEAIKNIELAMAEVEWSYPINYHIALQMAIESLKQTDVVQALLTIKNHCNGREDCDGCDLCSKETNSCYFHVPPEVWRLGVFDDN